MEQILIKGRKVLKGNDPSFKEVPCFNLYPGSLIISIGYLTGNNNTGGNMLDEFKQPVTYVGFNPRTCKGATGIQREYRRSSRFQSTHL